MLENHLDHDNTKSISIEADINPVKLKAKIEVKNLKSIKPVA